MKKVILGMASLLAVVALAGCGGGNKPSNSGGSDSTGKTYPKGTAGDVQRASEMTLAELEAASKAEMEASKETFKVLGLTSTLATALKRFSAEYEWIRYEFDESGNEKSTNNVYVNNGYKDYTLLTALNAADKSYVADYALVQDARSIADYSDDILHNFVPSDYKTMGLSDEDTMPLKGIHFNKIFWTNTNFENVTGKKLYNIWQVAGTDADADHLGKVSFQSPSTEQINMSFLLSIEAEENQARIKEAYKKYYGKDWSSTKYASAGEQWVTEFIANISRWHSSDGTAMKQTQLESDWNEGYVYYGAYSKMKDAAGKNYNVDCDGDGTAEKVNAMSTVKWNWEIEGFNGFMYTMFSQIVNNAKHPYTACLYARYLLTPESYVAMCHNSKTPDSTGAASNQYGYYYPCNIEKANIVGTDGTTKEVAVENDLDWTKATWKTKSVLEDYTYLKGVKASQINSILALVSSNSKAK